MSEAVLMLYEARRQVVAEIDKMCQEYERQATENPEDYEGFTVEEAYGWFVEGL